MCLVKPLLPSHIFSFIHSGCARSLKRVDTLQTGEVIFNFAEGDSIKFDAQGLRDENAEKACSRRHRHYDQELIGRLELLLASLMLGLAKEARPGIGNLGRCLTLALVKELETEYANELEQVPSKLFAAYLIEILYHLRFHDARCAREALSKARKLALKEAGAIDKRNSLESLGLISALVEDLEDRLFRIEPCVFIPRS